jgi:phosphoserine phosphatase RsbU/P
MEMAQPAGIALGAVFGTLLLWGGSQFHRRVSARIDRAFFRSAYDARVILQDLAEKTRTVSGRQELAILLEAQIEEALDPKSLACYLERGDGNLAVETRPQLEGAEKIPGRLPRPDFPYRFGARFFPRQTDAIPTTQPLLVDIERHRKVWEVPQDNDTIAPGPLAPECLVPILGRDSRLIGLLVLGQRLSEEPYSSEDTHLLESVASQAGVALETIHLAKKMAERMEAELRTARELEIVRDVQARLLPQESPRLKTLDCAGKCIEARSVGGDYYDYLDLGADRVGFVLADVSGKGVHAALLTANLQAYLRSQSGIAPLDFARLLKHANRMLLKGTASEHFATPFFGIYDDSSREMTYVNCGHNAPVWLRQDGSVERLPATATVIGMFEEWECEVEHIHLAPGELLAIFSDGVTEAAHNEEEYGDARLVQELQACRHLSASEIVQTIFASAQEFSAGAQSDDLTLVVAKVRP